MTTEHAHSHASAYEDKFVALLGFFGASFFGLALYFLATGNKVPANTTIGILFAILFLALVMAYFFYRGMRPAREDHGVNKNYQIWAFLASEVVFFTGIIGLSQVLRFRELFLGRSWGAHELDIPLTAINTFVLICSSFTMAMALDAAKMKNKKKMLQFLLATLLIGGTFISIQAFEYLRLIEEHFLANSSVFAGAFYLTTGFHGFHVAIGLVAIFGVLVAAYFGKFDKSPDGVEILGLYWHFVDLAWLFIFPLYYLI